MKRRILSALLVLALCLGLIAPVSAAEASGKALVEGPAVYDEVLDTYEAQHQSSVRFKPDGSTNVTGQEWLEDSETVGVNRERAHAQFVPYQDAATGLAAEKSVLDDTGHNTSSYYQLLSGKNWDFALVRNPAEAAKKDAAYLAETYTGKDFTPEYVPQAWQTYRNADGTFKYFDEPMYANHPFPWIGNFESVDYNNPSAPTVYNPVGYYRTTFQTPAGWDGREIFISLQSVESAYYLYINGECVGYSTDAFSAHDFDLTSYLKPAGETNTMAIKIFRWSIGSWLENQDFIRESGIYRDVYLYSKGEAEIRDFFVKTKFDDRTSVESDVDVTVETNVRGLQNAAAGDYKVSAYLVDASGATVVTAADQTVNIAAAKDKTPEQKLQDAGTKVTTTFTVTNPKKWFPDTPNLYQLVLQLKKGDAVIETAVQRIGFREVYKVILDASANNEQIQITGEQVIFRGTNRHDTDLETGHALTFEDYKADLMLMKQTNINAIRTAHYPNDRAMFDLADELGIYLCVDANVESHRAAQNGINVPTGPTNSNGLAEWVPPVLDRIATMTERYKNHASVVIWSLGNEATYSKPKLTNQYSFWVSSMYLLARDPDRIRKYEREENRGYVRPVGTDPWSLDARKNQIIDVFSTQYATPGSTMGYNSQLPFIHSEYNHAMGQAYGNAREHWDTIRAKDNVQGGFIWDWIDQSRLTTKDSNGDGVDETFWGYGGDWIDSIANDNAFCGNGIAYADRTAGPKTLEARKVHQQVSFYLPEDGVATPEAALNVQVVNEFENTTLDAFDIIWNLTEDGVTKLGSGTLNLTTPAMRGKLFTNTASGGNAETIQITLPAFTPKEGSDYLLDFSVKSTEAKPWAAVGNEVAYEQFQLSFEEKAPADAAETAPDFTSSEKAGDIMTLTGTTDAGQVFSIKLNTAKGQLTEYALDGKVVMKAGPEFSLWRPQTYNESGLSSWSLPLQNAGNPLNQTNLMVNVEKSANNKVTMVTSGTLKVDADSAMTLEILGNGEIVVYEQFIPKSNFASEGLPKVGTRMVISGEYGNFDWYGRGPWETYPDRKSGARVGTHTSTVDEQYDMKLLKPQENGNHTDVRWTSLTDEAGTGLMVSAGNGKAVQVAALHNTAEEINGNTYNNADNRHPVDIQQREDIIWSIDLHQNATGDTGFSTPFPIAAYKIFTDKSYSYSYRISPITENSDRMEKSKVPFTPPTAKYQVSSIAVNGTAIPGFSPIAREFTYEVPTNASSAVVTATSSGDVSISTNHNTGTVTVTSIDSNDQVETYTIQMVRAKMQMPNTVFAKAVTHNSIGGANSAAALIDGNTGSFWDFDYSGSKTWDMTQLYYAVELKDATRISSVGYIPRQDAQSNGNFQAHEIYVSTKPISELNVGLTLVPDLTSADWTMVSSGTWGTDKMWKDDVFPLTAEPVKTILVQPRSTANSPAPPSSSYGNGAETRASAPRDASAATVTLDASYALVGNAAEPDPAITVGGVTLIRGIDYTVAYTNNTAAGTATATISYKGQFFGADVVKTFTVTEPNAQELVFGIFLNGTKFTDFVYTTDSYSHTIPFTTKDMVVTADVAEGVNYTVEMGNSGVVLTASKGSVTKTYTIAMTREAAPATIGGPETFARAEAHDTHSSSSTTKMYDKNNNTYWENSWSAQTVREAYVALELKTPTQLSALQYLPRQESNQTNGRYLEYEVYVSTKTLDQLIVNNYPTDLTGADWVKASAGTWDWTGYNSWRPATLTANGMAVKTVLVQPKTTDTKDGHPNSYGCVAEISVTPSTNAADATVTMDATYPLVGSTATPDPVIMMGGTRLLRGVDYTVAYTDNTTAGQTATATITYKGVYTGSSVSKTFTVGEASAVLGAPTGLVWDTTVPGKAVWTAVENATGYSVQLFKDGMTQGNALTVTGTEKNFTGVILESGSYTFKVKALGDGVNFGDSPLSAASAPYAYVADYVVRLAPGVGYTLQATEGSTSPVAEGGSFSFTLTVDASHSDSTPVVKVNGVELAKDSGADTYTMADIRANKSVTVAGLVKNTYIITFTAGDETVAEKKVEYGGKLTLNNFPKVPAKTGYTGAWNQKVAISNVTENKTVTADYEANSYTVTFDANGGSVVPEELLVTYDAVYGDLPVPTHSGEGLLFGGWFTAAEGGAAIKGTDLVKLAEDHTLYAHWLDRGLSEVPETAISGMPTKVTLPYAGEGIVLTAPSAPEGSAYTYQWKRMTDGTTWEDLEDETNASYTIPAADILFVNSGWQYKCAVTNTQPDLAPNTAESLPVALTVDKGFQSAPAGLTGVPPTTEDGTDGKIIGLKSAKSYEYKLTGVDAFTAVPAASTSIDGLAAGAYLVRYTGTDDYLDSDGTDVSVPAFSPLDTTPIDASVAAAESAKSGVVESDRPASEMSYGTRFVTAAVMDDLDAAIAAAKTAKDLAVTNADVVIAVAALNEAVETFKAAIQTGTYSSGGGGSSNTTTKTEKNEDGSTTKTVTDKKTGNVTETTTYPDGAKLVAVTPKDGKTTIEATVPKGKDKVTVTIPTAGQPAPGEVAVIIHEDGKREVIKTSVSTKDGLRVTLTGNAKLEIMDNSKSFSDVPADHWGADAIAFVTSRELFNGGDGGFQPTGDMSRAMLFTVLARLDGQDLTGGESWYSKAMDWAKESGVSDGSSPEANINRESLAVMLYRYAGSPEVGGMALGEFTDAESVSTWASDAMLWCVESGILTGSGGQLNPAATATRAEVAAMLERFITATK